MQLGGERMISYKKLRILLVEREMKMVDLRRDLNISTTAATNLNTDKYVTLEVLERICMYFDCQISDICTIKKDPVN